MRQAKVLARRGLSVEIVCPRSGSGLPAVVHGIRVHRLPCIPRWPFRTVTYLASFAVWLSLHVRRYDLVHVHLANLQADVAAVFCRIARRPLYVKVAAGGVRGEIRRLRRVAWLTRYGGIRLATRVQAISDEIAGELRMLGVSEDRIVRIPNGYETDEYHPVGRRAREACRRDLALPADRVLLLFAGRFARYKGVMDLIDAWRGSKARDVSELVLVGEQAIDAPVGQTPLHAGMIVRDWADRVADYYHACDIFVLPSYVEGMSNSLLEAMACGMAVVATRVGAAPSMIHDGVSGLIVDPGDHAQLAGAIETLVADEMKRVRLGRSAAEDVASRFGIESVVDQIQAAYEHVLSAQAA